MVPFVDLVAQYKQIAEPVEREVLEILRSGQYTGGQYVERFERHLGNYLFCGNVVGVSNGTDAIQVMCEALNINKGGVIVPNNSFIASAFGVSRAGLKPVFVDCDPDTYLLDYDEVEFKLKNNKNKFIKAVLVVHLYGQMPNMEKFYDLCKKHKVYLLEDAAQAVGATYEKMHVGYYSHAAATSFYPAKNLGGCGQGGAIITTDPMVARRIRTIINQGSEKKYEHVCMGGNYRLDPIVAAFLFHALEKLDDWNENRRAIATRYNEAFAADNRPLQHPNSKHIYHLYEYKCETPEARDKLSDTLRRHEISYGYHYPNLITDTPMYMGTNTPVADGRKRRLISLPMHPFLSLQEVEAVIQAVLSCSPASRR